MTIEFNQDGLDALFGEIAGKLQAVDADLRRDYTGKPALEIEPVAARAFAAIGVNFTGELKPYAESVSRGEPFTFELG